MLSKDKPVSVIGGAGHVGLGLCLVLANNGYKVYGIDINEKANDLIMRGVMPFFEEEGEEYLNRALASDSLLMTSDLSRVQESEVIIIVLGTPIDRNLNPDLTPLSNLIKDLVKYLCKGQLIILRSTVSPGTTEQIRTLLEKKSRFKVGRDIFMVFAPERVLQGRAIKEIVCLPQLIGAFDEESYTRAEAFFSTFVKNKCFKLSPIEAEIGKLITNMTRYVHFALVNEYYLIADSFGANIHKIIDACNYDFPRLDLPTPGLNVGGPCLFKDGYFLLERIPFTELISVSFKINESMPLYVVRRIQEYEHIKKVAILGMSFKANSDDTRNSLSFKLKRRLLANNYELVLVEPNLPEYDPLEKIENSDCVILMTPHRQFKDLGRIISLVKNKDCLFVDIWGFWDQMRGRSRNGFFFAKEVS